LLLLAGMALLCTPRTWLRLGRPESSRSRKSSRNRDPRRDRQTGDNSLWPLEEFARRRNWLDFGRGLAGGYAVVLAVPPLVNEVMHVSGGRYGNLTMGLIAGVLLAVLLIQMLRIEERVALYPPIFFLMGLIYPLVGVKAATVAIIAVWVLNIVLPNPAVFLVTFGGLVTIFTVFFGGGEKYAVLAGGLAAFPALAATMARRRLAQFRKKTKIVVR